MNLTALNPNSRINKFYNKYFFIKDITKIVNFCDYFWSLLFALLSLPISFPTFFIGNESIKIQTYNKGSVGKILHRSFIGFVFVLLFSIIVTLLLFKPLALLVCTAITIGILALVIGLIAIVTLIENRETSEFEMVVKTGFSSFKNKYCPRIEWKGNETNKVQ